MAILSQAAEGKGSAEGAETRSVSPNNNPALERPASYYQAAIQSKVLQVSCGCWIWLGGTRNVDGYGAFHLGRNQYIMTHRLSYLAWNGPLTEGQCVLHRCNNPQCCNPDHLYAGSKKDNRRDSMVAGTARWNLDALQAGRIKALSGKKR